MKTNGKIIGNKKFTKAVKTLIKNIDNEKTIGEGSGTIILESLREYAGIKNTQQAIGKYRGYTIKEILLSSLDYEVLRLLSEIQG